jgi:hypothetical protein
LDLSRFHNRGVKAAGMKILSHSWPEQNAMKNLSERIKNLFPFITHTMIPETNPASFDFIRGTNAMLKEFEYCLRERNLVGVYCPVLGNGMFLVGVESILYGDDGVLLIFHKQDMSGHFLSRRTLRLDEISMIVPFNNPFACAPPIVISRVEKSNLETVKHA